MYKILYLMHLYADNHNIDRGVMINMFNDGSGSIVEYGSGTERLKFNSIKELISKLKK